MEICRVLCVPEAARRARSQARDFSTRPALLPPAGPSCSVPGSCCSSSCALLASTAPCHSSSPQALSPPGRDTRLVLASICQCLSQQPEPAALSPTLLPAQAERSCVCSRKAARTSYSHRRRCQLHCLGRYSSSLPGALAAAGEPVQALSMLRS